MRNNHARIYRTHVRAWLVAAALGGFSLSPGATFVTPASPPGFASGSAGMTLTPLQQLLLKPGSTVISEGPRVAGSGPTKAAYKLGAGAARTLARATIAGGGAGAVALGAIWLAENCIQKNGQSFAWTCAGAPQGGTPPVQSAGVEWRYSQQNAWQQPSAACMVGAAYAKSQGQLGLPEWSIVSATPYPGSLNGQSSSAYCDVVMSRPQQSNTSTQITMSKRASSCPAGHYIIGDTCVLTPPPQTMTPQQAEDHMAGRPLPSTLPSGVPYPIDQPAFNPILDSSGNPVLSPSGNPQSSPLLVPQGQPQKVPNTDPQQWRQPITTVTPAPTPADPWRVNVQPGEQTSTNPTGMTSPQSPSGTEADPKPTEEELGLCDQYPDILACAKPELDVPDGEIPRDTQTITYAAESPFGGGSCPANAIFNSTLTGRSYTAWDWQQTCSYTASFVRPIVLVLATFAAFLILMPGKVET